MHDSSTPSVSTHYTSYSFDLLIQNFASTSHVNASLSIKLDHNNYLIWSEQMENLIIAYSLEGFIDGSIVAHAQFLDLGRSILNPCFSNWNRLNSPAKS